MAGGWSLIAPSGAVSKPVPELKVRIPGRLAVAEGNTWSIKLNSLPIM